MKTLYFVAAFVSVWTIQASAQTNLFLVTTNYKTIIVTNWIQPSERYCYVGKQLYDKYQSQNFVTVQIPAAAAIRVNYNGPVDFTVHLLNLSANWREGRTSVSVLVKNFSFIRGQWNYQNGCYYQPGGGAFAQAMLISDTPNYDGYGNLVSTRKTYDCGIPMTTPYQLVLPMRLRVLKTNYVETAGK
ncbi:MAG TPA: hypothetical protein VGI63_06565 [Verrucomicrobiae bacterium]|jgi:hypothetical protein